MEKTIFDLPLAKETRDILIKNIFQIPTHNRAVTVGNGKCTISLINSNPYFEKTWDINVKDGNLEVSLRE